MIVFRRSFLIGCLLAAPALRAQPDDYVYEGLRFERHVRVADAELQLNGTGQRGVKWFKLYLVALYLPQPARNAADALAMVGPKRLQLRMLYDAPASEFAKAFNNGVTRNAPAAELPLLSLRMQAFGRSVTALGKVRAGDVVDLDLHPGRGTLFKLNGRQQDQPIAGDDFFAALLRAFIGERPYDARMRAGLLGPLR